ncbi:hypothetical protein K0M31_005639 [Melipona bicolor]|uniref:Small ribosomal subunit protein mS23 n=1 Tax=Melipona bicolor TaxID=60889 RepID=A0AA40KLZ2_9HYME|nr:hypothetical protein K0M31_005639 [Melipona bicolor]
MAQSRTDRIGTIFSRMTALVRADVIHPNNLPLWYEVYKTFPPKYEPKYNRKPPTTEIQNIFYQEDLIRAKFQNDISIPIIDMKSDDVTKTQIFYTLYECLLQGGVEKEEAYEKAMISYKSIFKTYESKKSHKSTKQNEP